MWKKIIFCVVLVAFVVVPFGEKKKWSQSWIFANGIFLYISQLTDLLQVHIAVWMQKSFLRNLLQFDGQCQ